MKAAKTIMLGWNEKLCGVASILLIRMAHAHSLSLINGLMVLKVCHTGFAISTLLLAFARILFVLELGTSRWRCSDFPRSCSLFCFQFVGLRNWAHRVDDIGELQEE